VQARRGRVAPRRDQLQPRRRLHGAGVRRREVRTLQPPPVRGLHHPTLVDPRWRLPASTRCRASCSTRRTSSRTARSGTTRCGRRSGDRHRHARERFPNIRSLIIDKQVLSRTTWSRSRGSPRQHLPGELSLEQLFFNRPVPGWARYRTPIKDLWMCGSAVHPAGGIMARTAASPRRAAEGTEGRQEGGGVMATYDAIVIGAVTTGWSPRVPGQGRRARARAREREKVGGILDTVEVAPREAPGIVHTVGRLRRSVVDDLGLTRHGLVLIEPRYGSSRHSRGTRDHAVVGRPRTASGLRSGALRTRRRIRASRRRFARSRASSRTERGDAPDVKSPTFADAVAG